MIDRGAGLDEDDDGSGALDREDEVARSVVWGEREVAFGLGAVVGLVDFRSGAVVDGDWEAFLGDV